MIYFRDYRKRSGIIKIVFLLQMFNLQPVFLQWRPSQCRPFEIKKYMYTYYFILKESKFMTTFLEYSIKRGTVSVHPNCSKYLRRYL